MLNFTFKSSWAQSTNPQTHYSDIIIIIIILTQSCASVKSELYLRRLILRCCWRIHVPLRSDLPNRTSTLRSPQIGHNCVTVRDEAHGSSLSARVASTPSARQNFCHGLTARARTHTHTQRDFGGRYFTLIVEQGCQICITTLARWPNKISQWPTLKTPFTILKYAFKVAIMQIFVVKINIAKAPCQWPSIT